MRRVGFLVVLLAVLNTPGQANACGDEGEPETRPLTPIYDVQGSGNSSPFEGSIVTVCGVVTGDFQEKAELSGFFVQELADDEDPATSDGIFVYHFSTPVAVGDVVEVTGRVIEHYELTELTDVTAVVFDDQAELPEPVMVELPLAAGKDWEHYEGMLVTLTGASGQLVVTETYHLGRGGLVLLADEQLVQFTQENLPSTSGYEEHLAESARRTIVLDDGSLDQNPDPVRYSVSGSELTAENTLRVGDTVDAVTGVVTYSFNGWRGTDAYRIHSTGPVEFSAANPRPQSAPPVGGDVRVATFNVLNFFNGNGRGGGFPTSRGADSSFELQRQRAKLVSAISALDAQVVGVIEIENDAAGDDSALAHLVDALNDEAGSGTYDYIDTGLIGRDEIKVGLLYQRAAVEPVGTYRILDGTVDSRFNDTLNRPALAQTFEAASSGARFTVIVNHLKSKGSPCGDFGDFDQGDGQGNCNLIRTLAAEALTDWAETLAEDSGDPDVLLLGDLNAYAMEDPIRALLAGGFSNLLGPGDYTYVFKGQSGALDHALATPTLLDQVVGAGVWSINAHEPSVLDYNSDYKSDRHVDLLYSASPYRSSDHDPVVVGMDLDAPPDCSDAQAASEHMARNSNPPCAE